MGDISALAPFSAPPLPWKGNWNRLRIEKGKPDEMVVMGMPTDGGGGCTCEIQGCKEEIVDQLDLAVAEKEAHGFGTEQSHGRRFRTGGALCRGAHSFSEIPGAPNWDNVHRCVPKKQSSVKVEQRQSSGI